VGRGKQGVRTQVLLQPFAYGVADRSAGLAIELFAVVGDSTVHSEFRFIFVAIGGRKTKSPGCELFPAVGRLRAVLVKIE
jgi:hypothetical protein